MTDFPFYREIEEYKLGLRPPVERFAMVVVFALCSMMVGAVVGVEQGRKPMATARQEEARGTLGVGARDGEEERETEGHEDRRLDARRSFLEPVTRASRSILWY